MRFASKTERLKKTFETFDKDSAFHRYVDQISDHYGELINDETIDIYWGIDAYDRTGTDPNNPFDLGGVAAWQEGWDPSSAEAQQAVLVACDEGAASLQQQSQGHFLPRRCVSTTMAGK